MSEWKEERPRKRRRGGERKEGGRGGMWKELGGCEREDGEREIEERRGSVWL